MVDSGGVIYQVDPVQGTATRRGAVATEHPVSFTDPVIAGDTLHDLRTVEQLTGRLAWVGLERFGRPLLYAIFAITLALPAGGANVEEPYTRPHEQPLAS